MGNMYIKDADKKVLLLLTSWKDNMISDVIHEIIKFYLEHHLEFYELLRNQNKPLFLEFRNYSKAALSELNIIEATEPKSLEGTKP